MTPLLKLVIFITAVNNACALFEDQAFKFDWRQQFVGVAQSVDFWDSATVIVRTSSNVLASLDADSGHIKWRHIFSDAEIFDAVLGENNYLSTVTKAIDSESEFTLSVWNAETGILSNENRISVTLQNVRSAFVHRGKVANLVAVGTDGAIKIQSFDMKKSTLIDTFTYSTGAPDVKCVNTDVAFVCLSRSLKMFYYTGLPFVKGSSLNAVPMTSLTGSLDVPFDLVAATKTKAIIRMISNDGKENSLVLTFDNNGKFINSNVVKGSNAGNVYYAAGCKNSEDLILVEQDCAEKAENGCHKYGKLLKISSMSQGQEATFKAKFERGRLTRAWASCDPSSTSGDPNYQLLLQFEDGSMTSVTPLGNLMWSREEALADIVAVQLVSIGLHVNDGSNEDEELSSLDIAGSIYEGFHDRPVFDQLLRRLKHHAAQLQSTVAHLLAVKDLGFLLSSKDTSVDDFGIRKVIVAATSHGKMYGLDSITGKILWQVLFKGKPFQKLQEALYLFVQRTAHHYGFEARCTLIFQNGATDLPELLQFNPLNGKVISTKQLSRPLLQASILHHTGEDHVKPILLVTEGFDVHLEPAESGKQLSSLSGKMFLVLMDSNADRLQGNRLTIGKEGDISLSPLWTFTSPGAKILRLVSKPTDEVVHSQGRVMADRSVLFKYINPNLGFILSEGKDASAKNFINVYLIDLVTGRIVFSTNHKKVVGPYHIVHSENWAVYTFYNDKARRAELISLELFEGTKQSNATVFSSLNNGVTPLVERQAFILGPSYVTAMKDTITDKGITSKHILMTTTAGAVYDVSRHVLDPRRPNMNTPIEMREPGLPPYIPELQFPPEVVLNYNQSVAMPKGISTAPTDLESTSVVFIFGGLDLYCTRVTPSKGFDLLKDDFDYYIISAVLLALVAASVASRKFSQLKNLNMAWR